jgi:hypothetical protein
VELLGFDGGEEVVRHMRVRGLVYGIRICVLVYYSLYTCRLLHYFNYQFYKINLLAMYHHLPNRPLANNQWKTNPFSPPLTSPDLRKKRERKGNITLGEKMFNMYPVNCYRSIQIKYF